MRKLNWSSVFSIELLQTEIIAIASQLIKRYPSKFSDVHLIRTLRLTVLLMCLVVSFEGKSQNFEISSDVSDSLSPTSYLIKVSGYATFTDSMVMEIELRTNDSLNTLVYSASKDFGTGGLNTLTNFTYDATSEAFSLDIGNYASLDYRIHVISKVNGILQEELLIHTY